MSVVSSTSTEDTARGFKIFVFIASGFIAGFTIANIIYFNRLRSSPSPSVSSGEASALMWLNVILLLLAVLAFIWSIIQLVTFHPTTVLHYQPLTTTTVSTNSLNPLTSPKAIQVAPPEVNVRLQ